VQRSSVPLLSIRGYPRNPQFFILFTALKIFAARKEPNF